jgi:hypothetical protein
MKKIIFASAACLALGFGAAEAYAMGGQGGPHDAQASPYALYAPESFAPPAWTQDQQAYVGQAPAPRRTYRPGAWTPQQ